MKKTFWEKRIPTLLGILMIVIGIGATSFLVKSGLNLMGKAAPAETPENIRITNISDSSFTVSYITADRVLGTVSYGTDKALGTSITDDRDQQSGNLNTYNLHYITIRNLKPSTKYFFTITSGKITFLNNDEAFEVTTGPVIEEEPSLQKPVVGKMISTDATIPKEAIICLTITDGQTISTLMKPDGSYILPLNSIRSQDLNSYFLFDQDPVLKMLIVGMPEQSMITLGLKQANPVPIITLSKNYDFTIDNSPVATISGAIGFPSFSASPSASKNPQILTPKRDEQFLDQKPLFKGTAPPGTDVQITIHSSNDLQANVKADSKGNWSYRPQTPLSPGEHTLSITSRDQFGILKTITQSFTVFAQGTQVEQSATPSATPTLTIAPTQVASVSPFLTPTLTATPTQTPTITPLITLPPKGGSISAPGNSSLITAGLTILGTTAIGIILFLITRGSTSL